MITKRIHSQDAHYKLSPKNSGETSLNLSNEILKLIAPTLTKGSETPISFTIYRDDYLKALGAIVNCSPLYITSSSSSTVVSSDPNVFIKDFQAICSFFGPNEKITYSVNLIYRNDGRIYLNALEDKSSKFNIRHFLLEERSVLEFYKDNDSVTIRLKLDSFEDIDSSQENVTELISSEKNLTSFVLSVIQYVNTIDGLDAIVPYTSATSPIKVSKRNTFKLTGMFLEATLDDVKERNLGHTRWFEDQFTLGGRSVFLSTQWNAYGDYQLTLDNFIKMIQYCYGTDYIYKTGPNGEHQLFFVSKKANTDLKGHPLQQIFYGAPGTGKSNTIKREVDQKDLPKVRTTFHPDSDYSTFVGAYKPTSVEVPVMTMIGTKAVPAENPDGTPRKEKKIVYEFVPQAFLKAYTGAWKNQNEPFFLIIEEINRGNCAQIFGDLFQLLDRNDETGLSEYPISPDEDIQKFLQTDKKYGFAELTEDQKNAIPEEVLSGELMILPKNLHIWATMNTSDQSLFPIDSAFKRRWDWQYVPIFDGNQGWKIEVDGMYYDWWDFLQKINEQIGSTTNSEDKKLGYYFCKATNGIINAETFVGKVVFYIWNDVFKDFAEEADGLFKDDNGVLSFNKFYTVNGEGKTMVVKEKIIRLLQNLGITPIEQVEEKEIVNGELEEISDSIGSNGHKSIRSVVFPDGKVLSTDNMTHFEVYLESLKKIGIETVYPVITKMKYQRKGCPLISTEKLPGIINSNEYSYYQEGQYFIVKGASDDTLINILNDLNSKLDLGIIVNYE